MHQDTRVAGDALDRVEGVGRRRQLRDVARAEMDTMVGMVQGKIDKNKFQVIQAFVKEIDFWQTSIEDAQLFLMDNYGYKGKLADDVAKSKR